jgi:DNA polymerase-3 subunit epsilon
MPFLRRPNADSPLHELEFAVVDLETTGRSADRDERVTEVGAVVVRHGRVEEQFTTLVNPGRWISPVVVRLTGITNAMVARAPWFDDVAEDIVRVLHERVFVAHNAAFDWGFLNDELMRSVGEPLLGERLCTVRLAKRLLPELRRRNLDAVTSHYDVRNRARHRAFGDAEATAHVFARMLDDLGRQGVHTWGDLGRFLRRRAKKKRSALPQTAFDFYAA